MTPVEPQTLDASELQGWKYFDRIRALLKPLHDCGCERDKAHNRSLHFDQYCALLLLAFFNTSLRSLRAICQASDLDKVQRLVGSPRTSLGSLSEAARVFDPQLLLPAIAELAAAVRPQDHDPHFEDFRQVLTAVDGTLVKALPRLTEAFWCPTKDGRPRFAWRLHTHFEILKGVPVRVDVTPPANSGHADEKSVLRAALQPDRCYVLDRWYAEFKLFNDIAAANSSYVCRVRENSSLEVVEERTLSAAARADGVVRDAVVRLGLGSKPADRPDHPTRLIVVKVQPHAKRGGRKGKTAGPPCGGLLLIATNLLDVPAEFIALVYRYRWSIEIYFRFFKHILGCRHLLSTDPGGIAIQAYCAILACLLISLWTGKKPTLRTFEMLCHYFAGWASAAELQKHLERLKKQKSA